MQDYDGFMVKNYPEGFKEFEQKLSSLFERMRNYKSLDINNTYLAYMVFI